MVSVLIILKPGWFFLLASVYLSCRCFHSSYGIPSIPVALPDFEDISALRTCSSLMFFSHSAGSGHGHGSCRSFVCFRVVGSSICLFFHLVISIATGLLAGLFCFASFRSLYCLNIPGFLRVVCVVSVSSVIIPIGHDHLPFPMCGSPGGANLADTMWWSVGIWLMCVIEYCDCY